MLSTLFVIFFPSSDHLRYFMCCNNQENKNTKIFKIEVGRDVFRHARFRNCEKIDNLSIIAYYGEVH